MATEHRDVVIIGAGLSGVGAACQLKASCPGKSFAILEARGAIGGTWDLFRFPGIRSDSDMFTLGYAFEPWAEAKAIADGPSIRGYIEATARTHGIEPAIRFHHRVIRAVWDSEPARWTLEVERADTGQRLQMTCAFLHACTGYYSYERGHTPALRGMERFHGRIVHPQHWPDDLDHGGQRVVVIGSGATAATLVPALAERAAHVTMLQRSPSYVVSLPGRDPLAEWLRRWLPISAAHAIVRWKNVIVTLGFFQLSRRKPTLVKRLIRTGIEAALPAHVDVDTHFTPRYDPWDQRVCFVPDGDFFRALAAGRAEVVTDGIETFTERGIRLRSGAELEADLIVTATGLEIELLGGMEIAVDGRTIDFARTVAYKGMMFSGVPNLAVALGYTNAAWTLKCDLVGAYVCRLLRYMDAHGHRQVMPVAPPPSMPLVPLIDLQSGYVQRALDRMPKQGAHPPWRLHQNYLLDLRLLKRGRLDDAGVEFSADGYAAAPTRGRRAHRAWRREVEASR